MRLRALLIAVAALAVALGVPAAAAGKAKEPPVFDPEGQTPDRFAEPDLLSPERVYVRAHRDRQGKEIRLFARVYRPNRPPGDPLRPPNEAPFDPDWKTPIILIHSPYNQAGIAPDYELPRPFRPLFITFLVKRGYTVVVSDARGSGNSGGCFDDYGPDQAQDFATLTEHFAGQPWSNGKVGGFGLSYGAGVAKAGATLAPRGLTTVVDVAGVSSLYEVRYRDGVPHIRPLSDWPAYSAYSAAPGEDPSRLQDAERGDCEPNRVGAAADQSGDMTPYYRERDFRRRVGAVRASMLVFQGFDDLNVPAVNLVGWYDELPVFKRAVLGQWAHGYPDLRSFRLGRDDFFAMLHAWFDYWLLDLDTDVESWPPVQVSDEGTPGTGAPDEEGNPTAGVVWRAVDSFADLATARQELVLGADRVLGGEVEPGSFVEGSELSTLELSDDAHAIWTMPVAARLHLAGQAFLDAQITLDRDDAHFEVWLTERRANGSTHSLTFGSLSAPHGESLENPTPREPGRPYPYRIRLFPFDKWVDAGSTLELWISGLISGGVMPTGNNYRMKIATDGSSVLRLPVVEEVCGINVLGARQQARPELIPTC